MNSACSFPGIADRLHAEQCAFEGLDRADVRLRCSRAYRSTNSSTSDGDTRVSCYLALCNQSVDQNGTEDRDVECFAGIDSSFQHSEDIIFDDQSMSGGFFELSAEFGENAPYARATENLDFSTVRDAC